MSSPAQEHLAAHFAYDHRVGIVAVNEVWFRKSAAMAATVAHFERFPNYEHPEDGDDLSPDFTVLFKDGTAIMGELANLALHAGSLDTLAHQLGRYEAVTAVPRARRSDGTLELQRVTAIDIVLFTPLDVANGAARRLAEAAADAEHSYTRSLPPMVLGWSYEATTSTYTFVRNSTEHNVRVRDHGRDPGMAAWLELNDDTLRGKPTHFLPVKLESRFMNDSPPELYLASVLWEQTFRDLARERGDALPVELEVTAVDLAHRLRTDQGWGRAQDVTKALRFLKTAQLAVEQPSSWRIDYRDLSHTARDVAEALARRYERGGKRRRTPPVHSAPASSEDESQPETLF